MVIGSLQFVRVCWGDRDTHLIGKGAGMIANNLVRARRSLTIVSEHLFQCQVRVFNELFEACSVIPSCKHCFPDLTDQFTSVTLVPSVTVRLPLSHELEQEEFPMAKRISHPTNCAPAYCRASWPMSQFGHTDELQTHSHLFHRHC